MKTHLINFAWFTCLMFMFTQLQAQPLTWDHVYTFPQSSSVARFTKIIQTENDELFLSGYAEFGWFESSPGFMRVDSNGVKIWSKGYNFPYSYQFITHTLVQTSAGNYFSFCFNPLFPVPIQSDFKSTKDELENDARLLKLNNDGDTLFSKHTQDIGWVNDMMVDNGKLVAVGSTNYFDNQNYGWQSKTTLLVMDTNGIVLLRKEYLTELDSRANSIIKNDQGNYLITGTTTESYFDPGYIDPEKMYLLELDNQGNVLWEYFSDIEYSEGKEVIVCDDGNYALIGDGLSEEGSIDIILWKFDSNNNLTHTSYSELPKTDKAFGFIQTPDGGFIICGSIISQNLPNGISTFLYLKTDDAGTEEWQMQNLSYYNCAYDVILNHNLGYYIAGDGHYNARLVKSDVNGEGLIVTSIESQETNETYFAEVYPNPGTSFITIKNSFPCCNCRFSLTNILGNNVFDIEIESDLFWVNTAALPKGLFFYEIKNKNGLIQSGKWIKE